MKRGKPSYRIRLRQEHASFFYQVLHWSLVGCSGCVEAAAVIEAMRHSYAPKTAGTTELSDYIEADVIFGQGRDMEIRHAISNTFGFGGHNSVIAFKRWEA